MTITIIINVVAVKQSPHVWPSTWAAFMTTVPIPNDCRNILIFPLAVAAKLMPCASARWRRIVTKSSRVAMIIATNHCIIAKVVGVRLNSFGWPIIAKHMNAPQTRILSASGSSIRPNLLVTLNIRATLPSMMSVRPATRKIINAISRNRDLLAAFGE